MSKRSTMPSVRQIVDANGPLIARLRGFVGADASATCWACCWTDAEFQPERAHVVGLANGGSNDPGNFFLLCHLCHREQPDGAGREEQEEWLTGHEWHHERWWRDWRPVCDAIMAKARAAGGEELANLWTAEVGADGIRAAYAAGADKSCRQGIETQMANGRRGVVRAFAAWLATREKSCADGGRRV